MRAITEPLVHAIRCYSMLNIIFFNQIIELLAIQGGFNKQIWIQTRQVLEELETTKMSLYLTYVGNSKAQNPQSN